MKIIGVDNLNRETVSDILIAENVPAHFAFKMVDAYNHNATEYDPWHLVAVADDHELYRFEP